jgi:hypothetical protein
MMSPSGTKFTGDKIDYSWIGHIIRHNEFVVNILEGAISVKKG